MYSDTEGFRGVYRVKLFNVSAKALKEAKISECHAPASRIN